ncbi:MAG: N-6 DNA methylase [Candidatus Heimdallarchaeota archaeon]|nr:N-6 DNA methylase [Candidatus Heimdallarchaeota archaeon]
MTLSKKHRRTYGEHWTPVKVFQEFIFPKIKTELNNYLWVDLFAGEGNLILPILATIPEEKRVDFFKEHLFLFDVQEHSINQAILQAEKWGIPRNVAKQNILKKDTLRDYPTFLLQKEKPIYHITNPPYLYLGYIAKHEETKKYLEYFQGANKGYQDLYQLGLINDLRQKLEKMIYIIPSNFLFGHTVSNKIRMDILSQYYIKKIIIFEKGIFDHTGTNVIVCFFERKSESKHEPQTFPGIKFNDGGLQKRTYVLHPEDQYRAGNEFTTFVKEAKAILPLKISFYLTMDDVQRNSGDIELTVIDANAFKGKQYEKKSIFVNEKQYEKVKSNILFLKTVDSGTKEGRAGLYEIEKVFNVDGILVTRARYRTHPIQIFIEPQMSKDDQHLIKDYFNTMLEYFREKTDSEFLTTYKYSKSRYTRKYLGLKQARQLLETCPIRSLNEKEKKELETQLQKKQFVSINPNFFNEKNKGKRGKVLLF